MRPMQLECGTACEITRLATMEPLPLEMPLQKTRNYGDWSKSRHVVQYCTGLSRAVAFRTTKLATLAYRDWKLALRRTVH